MILTPEEAKTMMCPMLTITSRLGYRNVEPHIVYCNSKSCMWWEWVDWDATHQDYMESDSPTPKGRCGGGR